LLVIYQVKTKAAIALSAVTTPQYFERYLEGGPRQVRDISRLGLANLVNLASVDEKLGGLVTGLKQLV
jgi:hypothetical protein